MIPSGCRVHLPVTSPTSSAFPKSSPWVGFPNRSAKRLRAAGVSGSSPFLTFRPPGLLVTQVSPTAAPKRPLGSRDFSTRANHASLPMHASGTLAVRIRQLTAVGLSPPKTCSLVGRDPGFEPATLRLTAVHTGGWTHKHWLAPSGIVGNFVSVLVSMITRNHSI